MKKIQKIAGWVGATVLLYVPMVVLAGQGTDGGDPNAITTITSLDGLAALFERYANIAIRGIFALAIVVFMWGVLQYIIKSKDDSDARAEGAKFMFYAIIAIAVMVSVWGLVGIVTGTFGFTQSVNPLAPFNGGCTNHTSNAGPC